MRLTPLGTGTRDNYFTNSDSGRAKHKHDESGVTLGRQRNLGQQSCRKDKNGKYMKHTSNKFRSISHIEWSLYRSFCR